MHARNGNWPKAAPLLLSLLLVGCAVKLPDCGMATPAWCSGSCLKKLAEWREASQKRLSGAE